MFTFWVVLWFVEVGMGDPPPQAKNSHSIPFSLIFLQNEHSGSQNKIKLKMKANAKFVSFIIYTWNSFLHGKCEGGENNENSS